MIPHKVRPGSGHQSSCRITLTRPLRSTAGLSVLSIIRETPLEGDDVLLVVDYEYVPEIGFAAEDLTAGVRARHWFGDHLAVGVTSVDEEMTSRDFSMRGVDVTLQASKGTYLTVEASETESAQAVHNARSSNGGLDYETLQNPSLENSGGGLAVNARLDLSDVSDYRGHLGLWYRDQEAGFNAIQFSNDVGDDQVTRGIEGYLEITGRLDLRFRAEQNDRGFANHEDEVGIQLDWQLNSVDELSLQYESQKDERSGFEAESDTVGLRLSRELNDRLDVFINAQQVIDEKGNAAIEDMLGVGFGYRATDRFDISAEYFSDGDSNGARLGLGYRHRHNSSSYLNYVTEQGRFAREGVTLGQRTELTDRLTVYSEHRFDRNSRSNLQGDSVGIAYDLSEDWTVEGDVLAGTTDANGIERERYAYSFASRYRSDRLQLVNRLEYRTDESSDQRSVDQWVSTNRWQYRPNDSWVWLGKADYSLTEQTDNPVDAARYGEADLGLAYRPVAGNRFNALAMISYIYDLDPDDQFGGLYADEKGVVFSLEGLYAFTDRLRVGAKLAHKRSAIRLDRDAGSFVDAQTDLRIVRARYHLLWKLDALAEYRWLSVDETGDEKDGALLGIDLQLSPNVSLGVGYNFTNFNDRLSSLDYESRGWFLNLSGHL